MLFDKEYSDSISKRILNPEHTLPSEVHGNKYNGLKVLGLVGDWSACGYYRIILPLNILKQLGANVKVASTLNYLDMMEYPTILAPRQHRKDINGLLTEAMWLRKTVVYEIDDDLHHVSPKNPSYSVYHQGTEELEYIDKTMRLCSGVTVSTLELGKWYKKNNQNVFKLLNHIDFSQRDWSADIKWDGNNIHATLLPIERPAEYGDKIVIGYSCGNTHIEDFDSMAGEITRVLLKYPNTVFAIYSSPTIQDLFTKFIKKFDKDNLLTPDRIIYIPGRHFLDHPVGLKGMDIQIGPLVVNQFNMAKSDLKYLEASASGAAFVGTSCAPYARTHFETGGKLLLVGQSKECFPSWTSALSYLIENPEKRKALASESREWVFKNRSMEGHIQDWVNSWMQVETRVRSGHVGPPLVSLPKSEYQEYGKYGRNQPCPIQADPENPVKYKNSYYKAWG